MKKFEKKKKLHKKAFTFTELLATLLIMSLVVAASVTGMVSISSTYRRVLRESNAEELSTLLSTAISGELKYAKYIEVDSDSNLIGFYSATFRECEYDYQLSTDSGKLYLCSNTLGTKNPVLTGSAYPDGLVITDMTIKYNEIARSFEVKFQIGDSSNDNIINTTFVVKALNV